MFFLVQGIGFGLAAAAQPGPFQAYLISQALSRGWRRTLPAALAPLLSDEPVILLVLVVLSQVPAWFQRVLHVAGGLFILYLAIRAWLAWRKSEKNEPVGEGSSKQSILHAALMNVLSPGPYLFWSLVSGPILLEAWQQTPLNGLLFLLGFYTSMILTLAGIIIAFGSARLLGFKLNRALIGLSAFILTCFGFYQLWLGVMSGS